VIVGSASFVISRLVQVVPGDAAGRFWMQLQRSNCIRVSSVEN
jgi:hypothetical protein